MIQSSKLGHNPTEVLTYQSPSLLRQSQETWGGGNTLVYNAVHVKVSQTSLIFGGYTIAQFSAAFAS